MGETIRLLPDGADPALDTLLARQLQCIAADLGSSHARSIAAEGERDAAYDALIRKLGLIASMRHNETGAHLDRVGEMAALLARLAGRSEGYGATIRRAAPLHDIGKILIPDRILMKPGALTASEREVMCLHVEAGVLLLEGVVCPDLVMARDIVHCHHERWDGTGYPRRLAGEDIPLSARITAIVDVFDALSNDRVYRPAMPPAEVQAHLRDGAGTHFDPRLAGLVLAHLDAFWAVRDRINAAGDEAPANCAQPELATLMRRLATTPTGD